LEHRTFGQIDAIGVDEIQYAKGAGKFLDEWCSQTCDPALNP
jgi:hypothetical protein